VRESLARFVTAIAGFIQPELVALATQTGVKYRTPKDFEDRAYDLAFVGAMDPAFRHDSFAFTIFHTEPDGQVVQDLLKTWTPDKRLKQSLDPSVIMAEIGQLVKEWKLAFVVSDQYQLESLQQLALLHGFSIIGHDFTGKSKAKMYGSLLQLLRTKKLTLLDQPVVYQQLSQLQRKLNAMGGVSIAAPPGKHDDVASVVALGVSSALQLKPTVKVVPKEPTLFDIGVETIRRRQQEMAYD
jgi:hypothetical protein